MKERVFDLNGRDGCVTATVKVADRTFKINRVVTAARVLYSNHLKEMGELLRRTGELGEDPDQDKVRELQEDVDEFQGRREKVYGSILTLLLTKNGYSYEKEWWENETDDLDVRAFIEACLSKDSAGTVKKK